MKKSLSLMMLASALCSLPAAANALDSTPSTEEASLANARDLFNRAVAAYSDSRYEDAYALFKAAWALHPHYATAANLGDCELRLGMHRDAAEHLAYALRLRPADAPGRANFEAAYAEARAHVGALRVVAKDGADLYLDGLPIGRAPLADPVFVDPGEHMLRAVDGAQSIERTVRVAAGQEQAVQCIETAAPAPVEEPAGAPTRSEPGMSPVIPVGIGLSVAGIGTGIALAVLSTGRADDAEAGAVRFLQGSPGCANARDLCRSIEADLDARDDLATGATIAFIAGGAAGIGTLVYALVAKAPANQSALRILPSTTPRTAGVMIFGHF